LAILHHVTLTRPQDRYGILPLGGRTNLLILRTATCPGLFVTPSHKFAKATEETIEIIERETGLRVQWLVTPSGEHGKYIDQWVQAFPNALSVK